jgi:hypothetical protein
MADSHDLTPHIEMWHYFTRIVTYSCIGIAVFLALMAIFVA